MNFSEKLPATLANIRQKKGEKMVNPTTLSNNILTRSFEENIPVTPMKLQKLIYLTYKHYLKNYNTELFSEKFEVWKYGPALRSIDSKFGAYKDEPIKTFAKDAMGNTSIIRESDSPNLKNTLDFIWENYKTLTGSELSVITRTKNTAWDKAYSKGEETISSQDIQAEPN